MIGEHDDPGGESRGEGDAAELSALFRVMRDERVPDDLEEKLLTAVAVGSAAWAVKSGFLATLFAKLVAATKGSTAATVLGLGVAAAGSLAAVQIIAHQTAPPPVVAPVPGVSPTASTALGPAAVTHPAIVAQPADEDRATPLLAAPSASAVAVPSAFNPRASTPPRDLHPRTELSPPPSAATVAPAETGLAPTADTLREEASRVRAVADLVSATRCAEADAAIQSYRAAFPRGQLAQEIRVLEARCASQK